MGSGYDDTSLDPGIILIERTLSPSATITSLKLIASSPCPPMGAWRFELISGTTLTYSGGWGESTFTWSNPLGWANIDKVRVALDTNRSGSSNPAWSGFLHTVEILGTGVNPFRGYVGECLPPVFQGCTINVLSPTVNVRRGPSIDDLIVSQLSQGNQFDARAVATDEDSQIWYGFEHPLRLGYLSWVVGTYEGIQYTQLQGCTTDNLPDRSTLVDNNWGNTLKLSALPMFPSTLKASAFPFRGFGIDDSSQYSQIYQCRHPGIDITPQTESDIKVLAVDNGIVVGIGEHGQQTRPSLWGATDGGYNLVIRTGGYFVLYGHLSEINPELYVGVRVFAQNILGTLANRATNTHLHLEVDTFSGQTANFVRLRFGAIKFDGSSNPFQVTDPIAFLPVGDQGTFFTESDSIVTTCQGQSLPSYKYSIYKNAKLGGVIFDYTVRNDMRLKCFNTNSGAIIEPQTSCISPQP